MNRILVLCVLVSHALAIVCKPGFVGSDCSRSCAAACNGHLGCSLDACGLLQCDCSGHGDRELISAQCRCEDSFSGSQCEIVIGGVSCAQSQVTGFSKTFTYATCNKTDIVCSSGAIEVPVTNIDGLNLPFSGCVPPIIGPVSISYRVDSGGARVDYRVSRGLDYDISGVNALDTRAGLYGWWFLEPSTGSTFNPTTNVKYVIRSAFDYGRTIEADARPSANGATIPVSLSTSTSIEPTQWTITQVSALDGTFQITHSSLSNYKLKMSGTGVNDQVMSVGTTGTDFTLRFYDAVAPSLNLETDNYNPNSVVSRITTTTLFACRSQCLHRKLYGLVCESIVWQKASGLCLMFNDTAQHSLRNGTRWLVNTDKYTCAIPGLVYPNCDHKHVYSPIRLIAAGGGSKSIAYDIVNNAVISATWTAADTQWRILLDDNSNECMICLFDSYEPSCLSADVTYGTVTLLSKDVNSVSQKWFLASSPAILTAISSISTSGVRIVPALDLSMGVSVPAIGGAITLSADNPSTIFGYWDYNNVDGGTAGPVLYNHKFFVISRPQQTLTTRLVLNELECRSICWTSFDCSGYGYSSSSAVCTLMNWPIAMGYYPEYLSDCGTCVDVIRLRTKTLQQDWFVDDQTLLCKNGHYQPQQRNTPYESVLMEYRCIPPQWGPFWLQHTDVDYATSVLQPPTSQIRFILAGNGMTPIVAEYNYVSQYRDDIEWLVLKYTDQNDVYIIQSARDIGRVLAINATYATPYSRSVYFTTQRVHYAPRWRISFPSSDSFYANTYNAAETVVLFSAKFKIESYDYPGWYLAIPSGPIGAVPLMATQLNRPDYPFANYGQEWTLFYQGAYAPTYVKCGYANPSVTSIIKGQPIRNVKSLMACHFACTTEERCVNAEYEPSTGDCRLMDAAQGTEVGPNNFAQVPWAPTSDPVRKCVWRYGAQGFTGGCMLPTNSYSASGCLRSPMSRLSITTQAGKLTSLTNGHLTVDATAQMTQVQLWSMRRIIGDVVALEVCGFITSQVASEYTSCINPKQNGFPMITSADYSRLSVYTTQNIAVPANFLIVGNVDSSYSLLAITPTTAFLGGLTTLQSDGVSNGLVASPEVLVHDDTWTLSVQYGYYNYYAYDSTHQDATFAIFREYTASITECKTLCMRYMICPGISYNYDTHECMSSTQIRPVVYTGPVPATRAVHYKNYYFELAIKSPTVFRLGRYVGTANGLPAEHRHLTPDYFAGGLCPSCSMYVMLWSMSTSSASSFLIATETLTTSTVTLFYCPNGNCALDGTNNYAIIPVSDGSGGFTVSVGGPHANPTLAAAMFIATLQTCKPETGKTQNVVPVFTLHVAKYTHGGAAAPGAGRYLCTRPDSSFFLMPAVDPKNADNSIPHENCLFSVYDGDLVTATTGSTGICK